MSECFIKPNTELLKKFKPIPSYDEMLVILNNNWNELKQFCNNEICERRDYSASKTFEIIIEKMNELESK